MAERPMTRIPFCVTSRSERRLKRCGTHESIAMFARTRGPSRKPACAATKRSAPSAMSVSEDERRGRRRPARRPPRASLFDEDGVQRLPFDCRCTSARR